MNGERFVVNPGQIFILYKNQLGYYEADEKNPWEYIWIGFDGRVAPERKKLEAQVVDFPSKLFDKMMGAEKIKNTRSEYLSGKLFEFFDKLFDEKGKPSYINQVKDYIKASYMFPLFINV